MIAYIGRRLLQLIPVFFGATLLIYFLVFAMPGDPIKALFGDKPVPESTLEAIRAQYNLDKPFIVQYLLWIKGIFVGDFGLTYSGRPVADELARAFPITARLAVIALVFEGVVGIAIGLYAGLRKGKVFDTVALFISLIFISVPIFVIGFLVQYFAGVQWGWIKTSVSGQATWGELLVPGMVLAATSLANIVRLTRGSVAENMGADFVRTAKAKGLKRGRVVRVHILRNSLIPVVTYLGADLGSLMVGAVITEGIFNIKGVGGTVFQAVQRGEGPTVVSFVAVMVIVFMLANLLVDLLYAVLDPRIRYAK